MNRCSNLSSTTGLSVVLSLLVLPGCSVNQRGTRPDSAPENRAVPGSAHPEPGQGTRQAAASPSVGLEPLETKLIMAGQRGGVDGVELGAGRNDGVIRLYGAMSRQGFAYEWSYENGSWVGQKIPSNGSVLCTPRLGDLQGKGNTLFAGIWDDVGVGMVTYRDGWGGGSIISGSEGKGRILSVKIGDGRNDGHQRLYIGSDAGLFEYSARSGSYQSVGVLGHSVGDFGLGDARGDGVKRLYAGERGGARLHELTWSGQAFRDQVIFECGETSEYAVHVGDGRGDGKSRVYAWCGGLMELTYVDGVWTRIAVDPGSAPRFYIRSGQVRSDGRSRLYVSQKAKGLVEYGWSDASQKFDVDVVTGATGGCAIGDGRGDGKSRLYVASGSHGNYTEAAVVELSSNNPPPARR